MIDLIFEKASSNLEGLDEEIRAGLGDMASGISVRNGRVIVHVREDVTEAQRRQAEQIVQAHNPNQKTARQQAEAARQAKLAQMRASNQADLDERNFSGENPAIRALAEKVAWLEQELQELRGEA